MTTSNKTLLDLSKVQHGTFYYVNQYGNQQFVKPSCYTVRLVMVITDEPAMFHPDYPGESTFARAQRLNLLDIWTPVVTFQLTANHNIQFTGEKAVKMWELWRAKIYGKKK